MEIGLRKCVAYYLSLPSGIKVNLI